MDCGTVRPLLLAYGQGRLEPGRQDEVRAHLNGCDPCSHAEATEHELTRLLEQRLPQHPASLRLKRRLAAQWPAPAPGPARRAWWPGVGRAWAPAVAVGLLVITGVALYAVWPAQSRAPGMVAEAVNDHVRILQSQRPLEVESGGIHQVLPWFSGRLDFAPVVRFGGDDDFPLRGGAVGYFLDRKAAILVYGRRLHTISLLVFRADGLPWPARALGPGGREPAYRTAWRGFNVLMWRRGELGYVLVSDVDPRDLTELAAKLSGGA